MKLSKPKDIDSKRPQFAGEDGKEVVQYPLTESRMRNADAEIAETKSKDVRKDLELKEKLFNRINSILLFWISFIALVLVLNSFKFEFMSYPPGWPKISFSIDSKVLIVLISTTTASVLGLYAIVANYLFPKNKEKK